MTGTENHLVGLALDCKAKRATENEGDNLYAKLCLVNGAMAPIHDIAWDTGEKPATSFPSVIIVTFGDYKAPPRRIVFL